MFIDKVHDERQLTKRQDEQKEYKESYSKHWFIKYSNLPSMGLSELKISDEMVN